MILLDRDRQIVLSIGRFGQLAAGHVRALHFEGLTERPVYRALNRLIERGVLARIERRMIGGTGAGSGQYVYQLGSVGWRLAGKDGRYAPSKAVNHHTMAIVDAYIEVLRRAVAPRYRFDMVETEPDSHRTIGSVVVRPDLYFQISDMFEQEYRHWWLEVDRGTESRTKITQKLVAYVAAKRASKAFIPSVLFVAQDDRRARELRWMLEQYEHNDPELFLVSTASEFAGLIFE
ncbi:replication-relaxation family protein [Rathayibacter festucae]|uniref:Replication-relaxation n=1 Tax=Rathayibacter festucae DSM 15932 TaxID=1328866 RepID=A0A3Q9UVE9_9MICO|nr:replication-relaxation family protein [Rathayibacter festucae]AZZ51410.1 hypothetical protein C1I64_04710 [Rathayibacter festucae DSM 15932]